MTGVEVVAPQQLSAQERMAAAGLYVEAFRRKLRLPLGSGPVPFVAAHLVDDRLLLAKVAGEVVGLAGLRYDGAGFFAPPLQAFSERYGRLGRVRAAVWRWTRTTVRDEQVLLDALAVGSAQRGTGVGSALLAAVDQRALDRGKSAVVLEVVDTNPRAAALYRRHGYRDVHTVRSVWFRLGGFRAATLMLKELDPPR